MYSPKFEQHKLNQRAQFLTRLGYSNQEIANTLGCFVIGDDPIGDMKQKIKEKKEEHLQLVETIFSRGSD